MKYRMGVKILSLLLFSVIGLSGCAVTAFAGDPLDTVAVLDLERYLGRWYEIARYQKGFERNIVGVTAEYSLREDGRIQVINSGFKKTLDGTYTSVKAVAWQPDEARPGNLKVTFFGLFTSDYLVFGLDEDYQWALVGNDKRDSLWFLSRTHTISRETMEKMKAIAASQGYDLSELYVVPQNRGERGLEGTLLACAEAYGHYHDPKNQLDIIFMGTGSWRFEGSRSLKLSLGIVS